MNIPMTIGSMITVSTIFSVVSGAVPFWTGILLILAPIPVYLIIMKALGVWGKKTYELGGIRRKEDLRCNNRSVLSAWQEGRFLDVEQSLSFMLK